MQNYVIVISPLSSNVFPVVKKISSSLGGSLVTPEAVLSERRAYADQLASYIEGQWGEQSLFRIAEDLIRDTIKWKRTGSFVTLGLPTRPDRAFYLPRIFENCNVCILHVLGLGQSCDDIANSVKALFPQNIVEFDVSSGENFDVSKLKFQPLPEYVAPPLPSNEDFESACVPASPIEGAIEIQTCLELAESQYRLFPGSHPVHITRETLNSNLRKYPYLVSKKVDGTRYLMVVDVGSLWFLNRKFDVWKGPASAYLKNYNKSLMDVEVRKKVVTVIDVISFNGKSMRSAPLFERLASIRGLISVLKNSPLTIKMQHYDEMRALPRLIREIELKPMREFDGLVFTPKKTSYRLGRNNNLLKWKSPETNTVDFVYEKETKTVWCQGVAGLIKYGRVAGVPESVENGAIIECRPDIENEEWVFYRERSDKENPNMDWIVENILESFRNEVTLGDLLKLVE